MIIPINSTTTIRQISHIFNGHYPFLKIVFLYDGPAKKTKKKLTIPVDTAITAIKQVPVTTSVIIHPNQTIREVEAAFRKQVGVPVQILRRSDNHWVLPPATDKLTLREQNELGKMAADDTVHPDYDSQIEKNTN